MECLLVCLNSQGSAKANVRVLEHRKGPFQKGRRLILFIGDINERCSLILEQTRLLRSSGRLEANAHTRRILR